VLCLGTEEVLETPGTGTTPTCTLIYTLPQTRDLRSPQDACRSHTKEEYFKRSSNSATFAASDPVRVSPVSGMVLMCVCLKACCMCMCICANEFVFVRVRLSLLLSLPHTALFLLPPPSFLPHTSIVCMRVHSLEPRSRGRGASRRKPHHTS
jgi:hypothetical protein